MLSWPEPMAIPLPTPWTVVGSRQRRAFCVSLHGCEVTVKIRFPNSGCSSKLVCLESMSPTGLDAKSCNIEASSECRRWDLTPSLSGQISCMKRLLSTTVCVLIVLYYQYQYLSLVPWCHVLVILSQHCVC